MIWLPPLALGLDMLVADPPRLPHPVRAVGLLADRLENPARSLGRSLGRRLERSPAGLCKLSASVCGRAIPAQNAAACGETLAGALALGGLCLLSASLVFLLCRLPGFSGVFFSLYLAWAGLALGGLIRAGGQCLASIQKAEKDAAALPEARQAVQMLVSRDTGDMDVPDLHRSLAESLSENLNDAFVAPFFWLCLGGPAALWAYKTVSTMDSMWGYKNERFLHLGRASARLDDVLAYVPARLSAALLLLAAWLQKLSRRLVGIFHDRVVFRGGSAPPYLPGRGRRPPAPENADRRNNTRPDDNFTVDAKSGLFSVPGWPGWRVAAAQAKKSASPNAGWPMATAAWLLRGRCGGPTMYEGKILDKPLMGPESGVWNAENCRALIGLLRFCGILCLGMSLVAPLFHVVLM